MIYALLLMWYSGGGNGGGTELIEGFKSYEDCNKAYSTISQRAPYSIKKNLSGVCMEIKDVR